jgi:predicted DNA-binding protein
MDGQYTNYSVVLTLEQRQMLEELAKVGKRKAADEVRRLIEEAYDTLKRQQTIADNVAAQAT